MKRLVILYFLFCSLLNIFANKFIPYRNVETTDNEIIVTYRFYGGLHQQDPLYPNAKFWKIPGFGLNKESGKPSILARWDSFAVPSGSIVSAEIIECEYTDTTFVLAPARHALPNNDSIGYTLETVPPISTYAGFYPVDIIQMGEMQNYRGQRIQKIGVFPIQYNHTNGIVRNYSKIKYRVHFSNAYKKNEDYQKAHIATTDPILNNTVLNPAHIPTNTRTRNADAIEDNRDYLIISNPKYENAINEFAEWKRKMGFRVHIVLKNIWGKDSIKSAIKEIYDQNKTLYYLLIVGNMAASHKGKFTLEDDTYTYSTDLYYGCMTENLDFTSIPDIARGRIPVNDNNEAAIVLNKIIEYEKNPVTDSIFYNTGLHCAYFQDDSLDYGYEDRRFVLTSEEILNYMTQHVGKNVNRVYSAKPSVTPRYWNNDVFSFGEAIPTHLKKPTFAWDGNASDIISHINEGCFYVLQRDHGNITSWGDPGFSMGNIMSLNNGYKLPVVFSMSCLTGKFDYPRNYFAKVFLNKANGGCVGIIAATEKSFSGYNDVLSETMFDAIWPDSILRIKMSGYESDNRPEIVKPVYELGRILDMGILYMNEIDIGSPRIRRYTREIFHCFGDPSMMIRTEVPQRFSPIIKRENGIISINTNCENARISFYTPSTNQIDSYIGQTIDYQTSADSVIVSINKHNYIPFIVHCDKTIYVQNDTINNERVYVGENILIGKNVTTLKEEGEVVIQNANVKIQGKEVTLHSGTTIIHSNVEINTNN